MQQLDMCGRARGPGARPGSLPGARGIAFGSHSPRPAKRGSRARAAATPHVVTWEEVEKHAAAAPLNGYSLLPDNKPSSAPNRVLESSPDSLWGRGVEDNHGVLLVRDTNAWCPFCERVWFALEWKGVSYDTVLVDLRNKPDWYLDMVPTGLVPAAKIGDQLVHESYDILKVLEEQHPEPPLLPADEGARKATLAACEAADDFAAAGYAYMTGGRMGRAGSGGDAQPSGQELRGAFEAKLGELEALFEAHGGPFIMGERLSLADVMYVSSLERFAAVLPLVRGMDLRAGGQFPGLARWYAAMEALPAYQKVKSDDRTLQMLIRKVFGVGERHVPEVPEHITNARLEAAAKLGLNHRAVLKDILDNSGILRVRNNQYGGTVRAFNGYPLAPGPALVQAVDHALRRVCHQLLHGSPGERNDCKEACAIGSAALVFFRNRASAPRDMSAAAAVELRAACSEVLLDMF